MQIPRLQPGPKQLETLGGPLNPDFYQISKVIFTLSNIWEPPLWYKY